MGWRSLLKINNYKNKEKKKTTKFWHFPNRSFSHFIHVPTPKCHHQRRQAGSWGVRICGGKTLLILCCNANPLNKGQWGHPLPPGHWAYLWRGLISKRMTSVKPGPASALVLLFLWLWGSQAQLLAVCILTEKKKKTQPEHEHAHRPLHLQHACIHTCV